MTLLLTFIASFVSVLQLDAADPVTSWRGILNHPDAWYATDDAVRIADNVLLYQHENGGWDKNVNMARLMTPNEKAAVLKDTKSVHTTIDNGATHRQLRYLAAVHTHSENERFRTAFLKGIDFLLAAQYNEGGWPQFYPLRKGYYSHITYNDGAMIGVMGLLRDIAEQKSPFGFVETSVREACRKAIDKGLEIILKTQIRVDGKLTAWCAQHDRRTLEPAKARSYELPSISGGESRGVVQYLMEIENPDQSVIDAITGAVDWYQRSTIQGKDQIRQPDTTLPRGYDKIVIDDPDGAPLWGRFYQIETNRPIFVGRDGIIKYSLAEIEHERRVGYSYLGTYGAKELEAYPAWKTRIGLQ